MPEGRTMKSITPTIVLSLVGLLLQFGNARAQANCFSCAHIVEAGMPSEDCLAKNVTDVVICDVDVCMEVSYQDPDTGEYLLSFLDCGSEACTEDNTDGMERITYNSSNQNMTERLRCCRGSYCNCNTTTCFEEAQKIENAELQTATPEPETTQAFTEPFTAGSEEMVDCFYCFHNLGAGEVSYECIAHETTEMFQCPGNRCMVFSIENTGSEDYVIYTLDCGNNLCDDSIEDGVEQVTYDPVGNTTERLTCCTGPHCNCRSATCLETLGLTTPAPEEQTTVELPGEFTTVPAEPDTVTNPEAFTHCFHCAHITPIGLLSEDCIAHRATDTLQCSGTFCMTFSVTQPNSEEYEIYSLDCGSSKCTSEIADGVEREIFDPETNTTERLTCCEGEYCNCNTPTCLNALDPGTGNFSLDETTTPSEITEGTTSDVLTDFTETGSFEETTAAGQMTSSESGVVTSAAETGPSKTTANPDQNTSSRENRMASSTAPPTTPAITSGSDITAKSETTKTIPTAPVTNNIQKDNSTTSTTTTTRSTTTPRSSAGVLAPRTIVVIWAAIFCCHFSY